MPVEKATTAEDLPMGQVLDIEIDAEEEMPDVEIEFDPEGGVVVNIGEEDDAEVPYDANLAEVLPDDVLNEMASTLSVLFDATPEFYENKFGLIPLMTGCAVAKAISAAGLNARVKWPNDVMINERKTCGILGKGLDPLEKGRHFYVVTNWKI